MREVCRFKFPEGTDPEIAEVQLGLAIIATESAFGHAKVRINAAYCVSEDRRRVAIDVSSPVGEHIAEVFTGLMTRQLGEEGFTVERVHGSPTPGGADGHGA